MQISIEKISAKNVTIKKNSVYRYDISGEDFLINSINTYDKTIELKKVDSNDDCWKIPIEDFIQQFKSDQFLSLHEL